MSRKPYDWDSVRQQRRRERGEREADREAEGRALPVLNVGDRVLVRQGQVRRLRGVVEKRYRTGLRIRYDDPRATEATVYLLWHEMRGTVERDES